MPKVDLFYLKSENGRLYAYSCDKKLVDKFRKERNMKLFTHKREKMPDLVFKSFMSEHKNLMLVDLPLYDGENYYILAGTNEEDILISRASEYIDDSLSYIKSSINSSVHLNEKYSQLIDDMTSAIIKTDIECKYDLILEIDTFNLFMHLCQNTFIDTNGREESEISRIIKEGVRNNNV